MTKSESCIFLSDNEFCSLGMFSGKPRAGDCLSCNKRVPVTIEGGKKIFREVDIHTYLEALNTCVNEQVEAREPAELNEGFPQPQPASSKGFGDTIAKMTSKVGIKPCGGCQKRKELLNKMLPYKTENTETNADNNEPNPPNDGAQTS